MAEDAPIPLSWMISAQIALLVHGDMKTDAREYRRSWPNEVRPLASYRRQFPNVVPVDRDIRLEALADRAGIAMDALPSAFTDDPSAVEQTVEFHRYVIYVDDGHRKFRKGTRELEPPPRDTVPLTLREGMFAVFHHGRSNGWRHGLVCAGSHDARGRHPVIAAIGSGFLLTAVEADKHLFRFAFARRGAIIPSSV